MNNLLYILLAGVLIYVALAGYVYVMQPRLIFYPDMPGRTLEATPATVDLAFEDVSLATADGEQLHGWYCLLYTSDAADDASSV